MRLCVKIVQATAGGPSRHIYPIGVNGISVGQININRRRPVIGSDENHFTFVGVTCDEAPVRIGVVHAEHERIGGSPVIAGWKIKVIRPAVDNEGFFDGRSERNLKSREYTDRGKKYEP
jgi:hypothetical protein